MSQRSAWHQFDDKIRRGSPRLEKNCIPQNQILVTILFKSVVHPYQSCQKLHIIFGSLYLSHSCLSWLVPWCKLLDTRESLFFRRPTRVNSNEAVHCIMWSLLVGYGCCSFCLPFHWSVPGVIGRMKDRASTWQALHQPELEVLCAVITVNNNLKQCGC